jgi:MinD-like ATPase involved in chromosome partitioning or flagellar assembly
MTTDTLALVGAAGGAGTTRLTVECGATVARTGRDVAVLDAAFATQGLARYVDGRIDADVTTVLTEDDIGLEEALVPIDLDAPGRVRLAPARAPFERLARAKTAGAAEAFEQTVAAAAEASDVVLVDVPPLAANQALAAVNAVETVALVTPDDPRGRDALSLAAARLADVGAPHDAVVATFADGTETAVPGADVHVPPAAVTAITDCPTTHRPDAAIGPAVASAVEVGLGVDLDLSFEGDGLLDGLRPS